MLFKHISVLRLIQINLLIILESESAVFLIKYSDYALTLRYHNLLFYVPALFSTPTLPHISLLLCKFCQTEKKPKKTLN